MKRSLLALAFLLLQATHAAELLHSLDGITYKSIGSIDLEQVRVSAGVATRSAV